MVRQSVLQRVRQIVDVLDVERPPPDLRQYPLMSVPATSGQFRLAPPGVLIRPVGSVTGHVTVCGGIMHHLCEHLFTGAGLPDDMYDVRSLRHPAGESDGRFHQWGSG